MTDKNKIKYYNLYQSLSSYNFKKYILILNKWGLGIGDWGLGNGGWGQDPIPNPQSPIPNPQSPFSLFIYKIRIIHIIT